ncbi:MAG: hypothetical protein COT33_02285 [Candidatus Nealsonbacteria bacterium CG08_land_8_20_14_0_20_38_20]|uniref:Uncharacterized protein n=1 Tax=Candidatus Nealsonbacteria bacterium CG08_land_8_20_14_0_20_38_20 TaxID=1974705 RepID=A0A2H0YLQ2_9BACT|nr:MAG: hypothetical protein COT33_02285 [Candidatus Nealsonbacteria bacterium CG08_land_8_20_14_0_20_38_20]
MLTKIKEFVKTHLDDIVLVIGVVLISLLSFAIGYVVAKQEGKEPLKIEKFQAPSTKFQTNSNDQNSKFQTVLVIRSLKFGIYL